MDRDDRLAVAVRAFVALGLEVQARQGAAVSTPEQRDEARAATDALLTAMESTGGKPAVVNYETTADWVGIEPAAFEDLAAKEFACRTIESDTPIERQIRDAMDAARWREKQGQDGPERS